MKRAEVRVRVASEVERTIALARRIGKRLRFQLGKLQNNALPDEGWRELAEWQSTTVASLARVAAAMPPDEFTNGSTLSDEEYEQELREVAKTVLRKLKPEERVSFLAEAGMLDLEPQRLS